MAKKIVRLWYDPEGDYLEVIFERKKGYFRQTENERSAFDVTGVFAKVTLRLEKD